MPSLTERPRLAVQVPMIAAERGPPSREPLCSIVLTETEVAEVLPWLSSSYGPRMKVCLFIIQTYLLEHDSRRDDQTLEKASSLL